MLRKLQERALCVHDDPNAGREPGRRDPDHRPRRDPGKLPHPSRAGWRACLRRRGQGRRLWARAPRRWRRRSLAEGCDTFFVAHVAEGIALRARSGRDRQSTCSTAFRPAPKSACAAAGLVPSSTAPSNRSLARHCRGVAGSMLPAALQVDSGMSRLGMPPAEVERIAGEPHAFDGHRVEAGHEPSRLRRRAGQPGERAQLAANSKRCARSCRRRRLRSPIRPASFSAAAYHFDLARPGAALYGINPTPGRPNPMRQVVRLRGEDHPDARRSMQAPASATATPTARQADCRAATISLGYADGWPRHAAARMPGTTACACPSSAACRWTASSSTFRPCRPARLKAGDSSN